MLAVAVGVFCVFAFSVWRRERWRTQILDGRERGLSHFAFSLGRAECDPVTRAVYSALVSEAGGELAMVRADDDLDLVWGIVGEDLEDVVCATGEHLQIAAKWELTGSLETPVTPRRLVMFFDAQLSSLNTAGEG